MKKNAKKNVCKENQYNVKIIRMNPATAMEQLLDVMVNLDTFPKKRNCGSDERV